LTRISDDIRAAAVAAVLLVTLACGTGSGRSGTSDAPHCPPGRAASWQRFADRVHMPVFCPAWLPVQLDGSVSGPDTTVASPGRHWQVQLVWRADDFSQLIHVVFEGFAPGTWPPDCGGEHCFGGAAGSETIAGHRVTWYADDRGSSTGHIAAAFRSGRNRYTVSLHVIDPYTAASARATVRRIVAGLVPTPPSG
jgi:hypothetical protein